MLKRASKASLVVFEMGTRFAVCTMQRDINTDSQGADDDASEESFPRAAASLPARARLSLASRRPTVGGSGSVARTSLRAACLKRRSSCARLAQQVPFNWEPKIVGRLSCGNPKLARAQVGIGRRLAIAR